MPTNKRSEQKEKRREEILSAALNLFIKKGYSATKTSDIAKAITMSDGLLFHYFSTKEILYDELLRIGMDTSEEWMKAEEVTPLSFFTKTVGQILKMIHENPVSAGFFVLIAQALRSGTASPEVTRLREVQEVRYQKTVALICEGQKIGEIRQGNPAALTYAFWCGVQGIAEQLAMHPETPLPEAEWLTAILKNNEQ